MGETHFRACNLCEAICGLAIEHDGQRVTALRGDRDDPFSRGHLCPKALALKDVHEDPDRLRAPLRRDGARFVEVSWDEAFEDIGRRLRAVRRAHGRDAIALCQGNPVLHNHGASIYAQTFLPWALRTKNRFSSTSVDNLPRMLTARWMYGNQAAVPVPDLDRTMHLLVIGANPMASNGSVMTAPDLPHRLEALRARGGRLVVIDPRRTETAAVADEHHFIRPGRDALFLLAFVHVLFTQCGAPSSAAALPLSGVDVVRRVAAEFSPERVAPLVGIDADEIVRLARAFADAPSAAAYGRMGVSAQEFGLLSTWLLDVINAITGNLDRVGGVMFTTPAVDLVGIARRLGQPGSFDAFRSRVRRLPEFNGELPIATLADEIETPGDGQVRAVIITAHNPVLSAPNGRRLDRAFASLELMVAVDLYLNETTRHAHYILPPTCALEHDHYDLALHAFGVRNTARFNAPLFAPAPGALHDWQIFLRLIGELVRDAPAGALLRRAIMAAGERLTPRAIVDLLLRVGPYDLDVAALEAKPHGVDLGPLAPRLGAVLATPDRRVDLAPPLALRDLDRLRQRADAWRTEAADGALALIGRRDLRSNNSWLHNSLRLVKGRDRCTLHIHPDDAVTRGVRAGDRVRVRSAVGAVEVTAEVSEHVMRGVVSLPHGWGHDRDGARLSVASRHAGVSANDLLDEETLDASCGTAALNGGRVFVERATAD